jgi:predicted RNA-binding Zn-ribbon protein involved in translation (DUF1610 family)
MSAKKHAEPRCDSCARKITATQHELVLSDPETGQVIGSYHAGEGRQDCRQAATKYLTAGVVLAVTYYHPRRCGLNQELCDSGLREEVA